MYYDVNLYTKKLFFKFNTRARACVFILFKLIPPSAPRTAGLDTFRLQQPLPWIPYTPLCEDKGVY